MEPTILEQALLPPVAFNGIKSFEEQDQILKDEDLQAIAEVYVRNQMHNEYGVGLLHRHTILPEGSVMVHRNLGGNVDICEAGRLDSLDRSRLIANSLFLNADGKFQAFEYDIEVSRGARAILHSEFLSQLRDMLVDRGLAGSIAIIPSPALEGDSVEYLLPGERGMIRVPRHQIRDEDLDRGNSVVTGWSFHRNEDGSVECKANKKCDTQPSGLHKVIH